MLRLPAVVPLAAVVALTPALTGCWRATLTPTLSHRMGEGQRAARPPATPGFGSLPVQRSPEYREAERRYAARDYPGAVALIDGLLVQPQHSREEKDFLRRQQAICQAAMGGSVKREAENVSSRSRGHQANVVAKTPAETDCGPRALLSVCRKLGLTADLKRLRKEGGSPQSQAALAGPRYTDQPAQVVAEANEATCDNPQGRPPSCRQVPG